MSKRAKPKFRVGQVVVVKASASRWPVRIASTHDIERVRWYRMESEDEWCENELRPLTAREIGPRKVRKKS